MCLIFYCNMLFRFNRDSKRCHKVIAAVRDSVEFQRRLSQEKADEEKRIRLEAEREERLRKEQLEKEQEKMMEEVARAEAAAEAERLKLIAERELKVFLCNCKNVYVFNLSRNVGERRGSKSI